MKEKEYEKEKWCHYSGMPSPKAYEKKDKINILKHFVKLFWFKNF